MADQKHCPGCKTDKDTTEFNKNANKKDGLSTWCKPCKYSDSKRRYKEGKIREVYLDSETGKKLCGLCREYKDLLDFYESSAGSGGAGSTCKICTSIAFKKKYSLDKDTYIERVKKYRNSNKEKVREQKIKHREDNKEVYKARRVLKHHGTTMEAIYSEFGTSCNICNLELAVEGRAHIDHDHSCCPPGKSCSECRRGILCSNCNTSLGLMKDSAQRLRDAADYLERSKYAKRTD